MKRTLVALLVSLLAVPALAGCLGGDDPPKTTEDECGARCDVDNDELTAGLGKVTGKIIDDAFTPIGSANVTLRELDLTTKTTADGRFAFNDLEPGTYTVFAQKVPTHKANGRQVEVTADTVVEADIILELLPPPAKPYYSELQQEGLIGCSVAYGTLQGADFCGRTDANAKSLFTFPRDAFLTALYLHLDTQAGPLGKQELRLATSSPAALAGVVTMEGQAPLEKGWTFTEENNFGAVWGEQGVITFDVRANHNASQPQVVYQQRLYLWVSLFYNDYPVPDGYTPRTDG